MYLLLDFASCSKSREEEGKEGSKEKLLAAEALSLADTEMGGCEFERAEIDALERVAGDPSAEPISLSFWLLRRITNDFSDESLIGDGGFSKVYLVRTMKLQSPCIVSKSYLVD